MIDVDRPTDRIQGAVKDSYNGVCYLRFNAIETCTSALGIQQTYFKNKQHTFPLYKMLKSLFHETLYKIHSRLYIYIKMNSSFLIINTSNDVTLTYTT